MSEPRIGRVLVASLHQAIADVLPARLEFYENWLNANGLREGTIGLAPLSAVLSFLRAEGSAYGEITSMAGRYAAEWTVRGLPAVERRLIAMLPAPLRMRASLRTARALVRATYPGSRAIVHVRRNTASIDLRGSLFCEVREASALPLCGFYAAAIARVLQLLSVSAEAEVRECRAAGTRRGCALTIVVQERSQPEVQLPENAA
jgi:bacteriochlorophyll 4-vinyl reductase